MKKQIIIMIMMCLSVSVSAQRYTARGVYRMQALNHQMRINRILNENNTGGYSIDDLPFLRHFIIFGFGVGGGSVNPTGQMSNGSIDLEFIAMNVLLSAKLGKMKDTSDSEQVSLYDGGNSMQIGFLIPIFDFDKRECSLREQAKGKIFIAPIIGFVDADKTTFDGNYLHENSKYHTCRYWVSKNTVEEYNCTEYGGALMVKYGCGYLMGKVTNKSWGISIGLCY